MMVKYTKLSYKVSVLHNFYFYIDAINKIGEYSSTWMFNIYTKYHKLS